MEDINLVDLANELGIINVNDLELTTLREINKKKNDFDFEFPLEMIREKLKEKLNRQMKIDNKELKEIIGAVSDKIFDSYS
jgi:hypothetical protein